MGGDLTTGAGTSAGKQKDVLCTLLKWLQTPQQRVSMRPVLK